MTEEIKVVDRRFQGTAEVPATIQSGNAFVTIFQIAAQKGYEPAFIEKMMELQERNDANEARKAYYAAVAGFKENPPEVLKDKENSQFTKGGRKAMYASLGNIVKTVNPTLGACGLSASWSIQQAEKMITVSCKLSHKLGHSETVSMSAPPDISGGNAKNPIQQIKSTITYLRGLTFESVTGLATIDNINLDDDGNTAGSQPDYITEKQLKILQEEIKERKIDLPMFLTYMATTLGGESLEKLEDIPLNKFTVAMTAAKTKQKVEREPGEDDK